MRLPRFTLAILACCILAALWPELARVMIYDRAAILDGAAWRLLTGHLVHFSTSHLVNDLPVFGLAGWLIEQRRYPGLALLYIVMPPVIGLSLLAFQPAMAYFGGMSGMAYGAMTYAALHGLQEEPSRWRYASAAVLVLLTVKLVFDMSGSMLLTLMQPDATLLPAPASHAAGGLLALLLYALQRIRRPGAGPRLSLISGKHGI